MKMEWIDLASKHLDPSQRDPGHALKITSRGYLLLFLPTYFQKVTRLNPKCTSQKFNDVRHAVYTIPAVDSYPKVAFISQDSVQNGHSVKKLDSQVLGGALCRCGMLPRKGTLCTETKAKSP